MTMPSVGRADYTNGLGTRLDGAQTLKAGRDVVPAQSLLVERRLDIRMDLEDDRQLVRQGNDRRSPRLPSKAFLPAWGNRAAAGAAIFGRCLLNRRGTSRTSADLRRRGLLQAVSNLQTIPTFCLVFVRSPFPCTLFAYP